MTQADYVRQEADAIGLFLIYVSSHWSHRRLCANCHNFVKIIRIQINAHDNITSMPTCEQEYILVKLNKEA